MKKTTLSLFLAGLLAFTVSSVFAGGALIKVKVEKTGKMLVDGKESTLTEIEAAIKDVAAKNGKMCYYRHPEAQGKPSDKALKIRKWVQEHQLAIVVSKKADFSDCQ